MFLGYPEHHSEDVYRFLNLKTNKTVMSKDIKWLKMSYGEYSKKKKLNELIIDLKEEIKTDKKVRLSEPN